MTLQLELRRNRRPVQQVRVSRSYWASSDTGHCWFEASSRLTHLQGLLVVGPTRFLASMLGDLGVSTLCWIKTMLSTSMLGDYSTSVSPTPSGFFRRIDLLGNLSTSCRYSTYFSLLFLFWIIIPAILPATMLGYYSMRASLTPSKFFLRHFNLLEACFL
jgi:hypothetical protein